MLDYMSIPDLFNMKAFPQCLGLLYHFRYKVSLQFSFFQIAIILKTKTLHYHAHSEPTVFAIL